MAEEIEVDGARERPGILQLALPAILGNLLYGIVGLVQTKVVGQLGAEALAAVGAGQRVFFALQAVMMAIGAGTTALVARAWGRNDEAEASGVFGVPTFVFDGELFWGGDRIGLLRERLDEKGVKRRRAPSGRQI